MSYKCELCGTEMKLRTRLSGPQKGHRYWVCLDYPSCKFQKGYAEQGSKSIWKWFLEKGRFCYRKMAPQTEFQQKSKRNELYGRLLSQVLGDREKAGRLIKYAQDKHPGLTEEQCIEMASESLSTDIRRWD
jgi:hypothetical protein